MSAPALHQSTHTLSGLILSLQSSVSFQSLSEVPLCWAGQIRRWAQICNSLCTSGPGRASAPLHLAEVLVPINPTWRSQPMFSLAVSHGEEGCVERPLKLHQEQVWGDDWIHSDDNHRCSQVTGINAPSEQLCEVCLDVPHFKWISPDLKAVWKQLMVPVMRIPIFKSPNWN